MKFSEFSLDARINSAINAAGYSAPTPIQEQAMPHVLAGKDVMGLAQTGTGKTAAFMLPILQHLTKSQSRKVRALVVAPTRELAEQINETAVQFGAMTRARSITVYGGVSKVRQVQQLRRGADIVVACPGRLLDIMGDKAIDLSGIEILVLDEADRMCDMGFLPDIRRILKALPTKRQTLFFSATMPDDIRNLSAEFLTDPVTVQIGIIAPAETVSHAIYPVTDGLKKPLLLEMLQSTATGRVLIFTRTKRRARNLAGDLLKQGYNATALQGNMAQNRRQESINGFRDGKYDILVATDIAARGIDVTEISHVINYDMPDTVDAYTHRIGRTGRAEQTGKAFTFSVHDDEAMVRDIEKTLGEPLERRALDGFNYSGFSINSQNPDVWAVARGGGGGSSRNSRNQSRSNKARNSRLNGAQGGPASGSSTKHRRPRRRPYANPGSRG